MLPFVLSFQNFSKLGNTAILKKQENAATTIMSPSDTLQSPELTGHSSEHLLLCHRAGLQSGWALSKSKVTLRTQWAQIFKPGSFYTFYLIVLFFSAVHFKMSTSLYELSLG